MSDREKLEEMQVNARASHLAQEARIEELEKQLVTARLLLKRSWKIHQHGELYPEQAGEHAERIREFVYGEKHTPVALAERITKEAGDGRHA